jgi:Holliday junction resolvasome RuvABC endonuclease subunit
LKKFATDNGDADKLQMTRVAQRLYGIETEDDNTADACHVAMYALHEFSKKVRGLS